MDLQELLAHLGRGWKTVVAFTLVGGLVGVGASALSPTTYRADAQVFISVEGASDPQGLLGASNFSVQQAVAFARVVMTDAVLSSVADESGMSVRDLREDVTATAIDDSPIIAVSVEASSADEAVKIADGVAASLIETATDLSGGGDTGLSFTVIQPGTAESGAVSPRWLFNVVLGLVAGALLGLIVVLTVAASRGTGRSVAERR